MTLLDFSELSPKRHGSKKPLKIVLGIGALVATITLGSTLAASINLNSGGPVEFGQGVAQAVVCDSNGITLRPESSFVNASGAGSFKASAIVVSDVDSGLSGCSGKSLTISSYGDTSSTPIASIVVTVSSVSPWFTIPTTTGVSLTNVSISAFTITIDPTVIPITASDVYKFTVESSEAAAEAAPATYSVGQTGPGGGKIFYVDNAGFNCGENFTSTGSPTGGKCNYLEVAPSGWNGGEDTVGKTWAQSGNGAANVGAIDDDVNGIISSAEIGLGLKNSKAIVSQGNDNTTAAGAARAYLGGSKNDWYLPTVAEFNTLCQWNKGVTQSFTTLCPDSSVSGNSATFGANTIALQTVAGNAYWTSSEQSSTNAWIQGIYSGTKGGVSKTNNLYFYVRPIRAF